MSRKIRTPKGQVLALPSPAMTFYVLTGQQAKARIKGWAAVAMPADPAVAADAAWLQHREALIAEAAEHGFEPFGLTKKRPTGDGFEQWRALFLAAHTY